MTQKLQSENKRRNFSYNPTFQYTLFGAETVSYLAITQIQLDVEHNIWSI